MSFGICLIYISGGHFGMRNEIKFRREHFEEYFCAIIMNSDQWFMRRCHL